jgi:hypothetical protein
MNVPVAGGAKSGRAARQPDICDSIESAWRWHRQHRQAHGDSHAD